MNNLPVNVTDGATGNVQTVASSLADGRTPSGAAEVAASLYAWGGASQDRVRFQSANVAGSGTGSLLLVAAMEGTATALNITAASTVKSGTGRLFKVIVVTPGSTASTVADAAGASSAATTILTIPATAAQGTIYVVNAPLATGLRVEPGTGAVLAVVYS